MNSDVTVQSSILFQRFILVHICRRINYNTAVLTLSQWVGLLIVGEGVSTSVCV